MSKDVHISRKKEIFPISEDLRKYLKEYERESQIPISYKDLLHFDQSIPLLDKDEKDTLWKIAMYPQHEIERIYNALKQIYA